MSWRLELLETSRNSVIRGGPGEFSAFVSEWSEYGGEERGRTYVITDANVARERADELEQLSRFGPARPLILPAGEPTKDLDTLGICYSWLAEGGARRDDVVIAFGGGVIGDLAGFAAATYLRGVSLWQVPTSLLAQVDSSVGGKVAINLPAGKNLAGAFYQPDVVVIDPVFLDTLPREEFRNGLGEVLKYALLEGEGLMALVEGRVAGVNQRLPRALDEITERCVRYKAAVVQEDERETGLRAALNLGHTIGHALEKYLGYGRVGHGQAVALGLLAALRVSEELLDLDRGVRPRMLSLMTAIGISAQVELPDTDGVLEATGWDKKLTAAGRGYVGLRRLGEPVLGLDPSDDLLLEALEVIRI